MFRITKVLCIATILVLAFLLGTQNPQVVTLNYIVASSNIPLAVVISIAFSIGIIVGILISFKVFTSLKWHNYRLKRKNKLSVLKDS